MGGIAKFFGNLNAANQAGGGLGNMIKAFTPRTGAPQPTMAQMNQPSAMGNCPTCGGPIASQGQEPDADDVGLSED